MAENCRKHLLVAVLVAAIAIRALFALLPTVTVSDCRWYHEAAQVLADGEGFSVNDAPTAYRMPGYSFVLGIAYRALGANPIWGRFLNALFGALTVMLLWKFFQKNGKPKTGHIAAIILALYPEHIMFGNALTGETILAALLLLWMIVQQRRRKWGWIWSGILVGIMGYIRSMALPLALLPMLWDKKHWRQHIYAAVIAASMLTPWVYRNSKQLNAPVLATNFWVNLWIGNGSQSDGGYFDPDDLMVKDEVQAERYYRSALFSDLREKPLRPVLLLPMKLLHFALPAMTAVYWGFNGVLSSKTMKWIAVLFTALNVLLIGAFIIALIRRKVPRQIWLTAAYFIATALVFFGNDRFRFPIMPLLLLGAALNLENRQ